MAHSPLWRAPTYSALEVTGTASRSAGWKYMAESQVPFLKWNTCWTSFSQQVVSVKAASSSAFGLVTQRPAVGHFLSLPIIFSIFRGVTALESQSLRPAKSRLLQDGIETKRKACALLHDRIVELFICSIFFFWFVFRYCVNTIKKFCNL